MLRRFSPRRNLWPEVVAYDERARELEQRAATLSEEIAHRQEALRAAVEADRQALTEWQLADGKRPRPEPTAPAVEREIEDKKADRDAALAARDRVYEDKARFVEKHRRRLIREADKTTREARDRYTNAIAAAEEARDDLVDSRAASLWAALFPGALANQSPATRPRSPSTSAGRSSPPCRSRPGWPPRAFSGCSVRTRTSSPRQ